MTPETQPPGLGKLVTQLVWLVTQLVTNAMKLAGLYIATHELLLRQTLRPIALAEAAFMMAGGRFSQHMLMSILDRLLGHPSEVQAPPPSQGPPAP